MLVVGRGYRDEVRNLEVMMKSLEWWEQAGDTRRQESYRAEIFFV